MQLQGIITQILLVWRLHFFAGEPSLRTLSPAPPSPSGKDKSAVGENECVLIFACMGLLLRSGDNRVLIRSPISVGVGNVRIKHAARMNWTPPDTPAFLDEGCRARFPNFLQDATLLLYSTLLICRLCMRW